ncbi:MAG: taurine ABC transporter permease, partial [Paraburkholderia tropica]
MTGTTPIKLAEHANPAVPPAVPRQARRRRASRYGAPGQGNTGMISAATTVALIVLWWAATHFGWIKPLFLPSPGATFDAFIGAIKGDT